MFGAGNEVFSCAVMVMLISHFSFYIRGGFVYVYGQAIIGCLISWAVGALNGVNA